MLEEVEFHHRPNAQPNNLARDAALTTAKVKFELFREKLQAAVDKYKSTLTYRVHEKTSKKTGTIHPRLADVNELQTILNNASYNVPLKDDMLKYINDREHFKRSKLSPLRRYVRNAVNQYIKEHNIESLELIDAILAIYSKDNEASVGTVQESVDEDSESKFSEDLQAHLKIINQQQLELQQAQQRLQDAQREVERLNASPVILQVAEEKFESVEEKQRIRLELIHATNELAVTKESLVVATTSLDQATKRNRDLELENKQQAVSLNKATASLDQSTKRNRELELELESKQQAVSLGEAAASLDQATKRNRDLEHENKQQAETINQQSAQINSLKTIITELKAKVESLFVVVDNTFRSIYHMYTGVVAHLRNAVKEPKQPQEQPLAGAEFRKQIRKEMRPVAKGGGGPIHSLIKEERDPVTNQRFREEILANYYADEDSVKKVLAEAKLLSEQAVIIMEKTIDVKINHAESTASHSAPPTQPPFASTGGVAPPPPPPPPSGEDAKKAVRVLPKAPVKKPEATPPASKPGVDVNHIKKLAEARAERARKAAEANNADNSNKSEVATVVKPHLAVEQQENMSNDEDKSPLHRGFSMFMKKNPNLDAHLAGRRASLEDDDDWGDSDDDKPGLK